MPLTPAQIQQLDNAIIGYNFPAVYFDFDAEIEITALNMTELETAIAGQLRSPEMNITKYGLANVLYWGFAQIGFRQNRIDDFMNNISDHYVMAFQALLRQNEMPTMKAIKTIGLPQYSGISFISKILMFLDPLAYCVLDQQLAKLRTPGSPKILNALVFGESETQIRITNHNEAVYNGWRNECATISHMYFQGIYRVVDIERGFFNLIQQNNLQNAKAIYNDA
jgi:hypothetical protein